jgi:hypothetical protein
VAFSVALKHKLRFEPYTSYDDLAGLVGHLETYAGAATTPDVVELPKRNIFKATGEYLGLSFAESNPRKAIKKAKKPIGNLPLEILTYLAAYVDETIEAGLLKIPMQQTLACKNTPYPRKSNATDTVQTITSLPSMTSSLVPSEFSTHLSQLPTPSPSLRLPGFTSSCFPFSYTKFSAGLPSQVPSLLRTSFSGSC